MKLKSGFCTQEVGDGQVMVPIDEAKTSFKGIVRSNETAAFVVDCLKEDTSKEEILAKLKAEYDGPEEVMVKDLDLVLEKLSSIGAIEG